MKNLKRKFRVDDIWRLLDILIGFYACACVRILEIYCDCVYLNRRELVII